MKTKSLLKGIRDGIVFALMGAIAGGIVEMLEIMPFDGLSAIALFSGTLFLFAFADGYIGNSEEEK